MARRRQESISRFDIATNLLGHVKFKKFRRELGYLSENECLALLVRFWIFTANYRGISGNLEDIEDWVFADACGWNSDSGSPEILTNALIKAGFLDKNRIVHNWVERQGLVQTILYHRKRRERRELQGAVPKSHTKDCNLQTHSKSLANRLQSNGEQQYETNTLPLPSSPLPSSPENMRSCQSPQGVSKGDVNNSTSIVNNFVNKFGLLPQLLPDLQAIQTALQKLLNPSKAELNALMNATQSVAKQVSIDAAWSCFGNLKQEISSGNGRIKNPVAYYKTICNQKIQEFKNTFDHNIDQDDLEIAR